MSQKPMPKRLEIWFSPEELEMLEDAAEREDECVREWARKKLVRLARHQLKRRTSSFKGAGRVTWRSTVTSASEVVSDDPESLPLKPGLKPPRKSAS
jgi:hypothetical protein